MLSYYPHDLTHFYRSKKAYPLHRNISVASMYYTMQ